MMGNFTQEGHLTQACLGALFDGGLDEPGRLEAAEHLEYCDACMGAYTRLLDEGPLEAPPRPLAAAVARQARQKRLRAALVRYATVAAAACLAVGMWLAGSFLMPQDGLFEQGGGRETLPARGAGSEAEAGTDGGFGARLGNVLGNTASGIDGFLGALNGLDAAGDAQDALARAEEQRNTQRSEREKVFERQKDMPRQDDAA